MDTRKELVKDLLAYPELRWLDENHRIAPMFLVFVLALFGLAASAWFPELGTTPSQILV
jgi:hypothetical protein